MFWKRFIRSKKNVLVYLMITIIPTITISHALALQKIQEIENIYMDMAQSYANLHASQIDRFIGETVSRIDMLATLIEINPDDLSNVEEILKRTREKDVRFSGFYWSNPEGDLLIGTNELLQPINIGDRPYFQEAIQTGQYTISPAHIGRVTGRFIITIATPVLNNGELSGVLLSSLRIDKIEESVIKHSKDEEVWVIDDTGQMIIGTGSNLALDGAYSFTVEIDKVPWRIQAQLETADNNLYAKAFFTNVVILLIFTHILFMLIQYSLLKRQLKIEKKQNEMQKMELVENLAASTAHEIRNPLTGIKGLVQLLSEKYNNENDQLYFNVIQQEVNRINTIVSELLLLGKPTAHKLSTYCAKDIIKEIEPIIHSEANFKSVDLSIEYTYDRLPISCVKDHLKQVLLNLIKNALDAVSENSGQVRISLEKKGKYCVIHVIDSGIGMPEDILNRVFEPFFTTKETGTGLGLVVCKRIVESYGGKIQIDSTVGKGTEVELKLPIDENNN
ncbi:ATP-binding protein [Alkalihalobacterium sp. APHAB7]|uniref:ATP-binding protein n=1 Tax=Alkalihalobacterium sp. APHAB7 TaxID=3402081 RepID=UPI003AADACE6